MATNARCLIVLLVMAPSHAGCSARDAGDPRTPLPTPALETAQVAVTNAPDESAAVVPASPTVYSPRRDPLADICWGELREYCPDNCPTFSKRTTQVRGDCGHAKYLHADIGRCPDGSRWIQHGHTFDNAVEYFNEDGELISARQFQDYPAYCEHTSFGRGYGLEPPCHADEATREAILCSEGASNPPIQRTGDRAARR